MIVFPTLFESAPLAALATYWLLTVVYRAIPVAAAPSAAAPAVNRFPRPAVAKVLKAPVAAPLAVVPQSMLVIPDPPFSSNFMADPPPIRPPPATAKARLVPPVKGIAATISMVPTTIVVVFQNVRFCSRVYWTYSLLLSGRVPQGSIIPTGSCPRKEYESANQPAPTMGGSGSWERNFFDEGSNTRAPISASPPTASVPEPVNDTPSGSPTLVSSADAPEMPGAPSALGKPGVCDAAAPVTLMAPSPGALRAPKPTPVLGTPGTLQGSNPPGTPAWENPPSAPAAGMAPAPSRCGAEEVGSHSSGTVT